MRVKSDTFVELGGPAALSGASSSSTTTAGTLGAHVESSVGNSMRLVATAGWNHVFEGYASQAGLAFAGGPAFTVNGANRSRNSALLDLSGVVAVSNKVTLNLSYHGLFGNNGSDNAGSLGLNVTF
jgi:uncharacterized protein with beta-barrel porin domain